MLFVIHAVDKPDALDTRLLNYDDHKAFLSDTSAFGVHIVMSGPLTADDGTVERFNGADPFHHVGIWERVTITGFIRRQG